MYTNIEGYKGYFREYNICSCEMLDFGTVKCDLLSPRETFSIKMLPEMIITGDKIVNCKSAVQINEMNFRRPFKGRYIIYRNVI